MQLPSEIMHSSYIFVCANLNLLIYLHSYFPSRKVVQTTSLRGYGGIPSSGGLSAMCRVLSLVTMSGRCRGQGGGAAKTHKEPPSQVLNIDKFNFVAF